MAHLVTLSVSAAANLRRGIFFWREERTGRSWPPREGRPRCDPAIFPSIPTRSELIMVWGYRTSPLRSRLHPARARLPRRHSRFGEDIKRIPAKNHQSPVADGSSDEAKVSKMAPIYPSLIWENKSDQRLGAACPIIKKVAIVLQLGENENLLGQ